MNKKKSKKVFKIILLVGTIVSMYFVPWILIKAWINPLPNTVQAQVNEALEYDFDGIIVYVDKLGEPAKFYTAGWHNPKNKIPAKPNALFKIASISKLYTAVAITKLVSRGKLSLDKTLANYLPELLGKIENSDKITLKMLLQHRSGIPNYTDTKNYWVTPKETNSENLKLVFNLPAKFKPDTNYAYSNTNYLLLAEIMNKVLGYDHFQFIQKEILNRLHLKNTYASVKNVNLNEVMSGYYVGYHFDLKTDDQGMVASAEDVGIFLRNLNNGNLFDNNEQEIYASVYKYEHTGLVPGYQSIAKYHKDIDAVIIQFTGPTNFDGYNWNLAEIIYNRIVKIIEKEHLQ